MLAMADVEIDGLTYQLSGDEAKLMRGMNGDYAGDIVIPERVSYENKEYTVPVTLWACRYWLIRGKINKKMSEIQRKPKEIWWNEIIIVLLQREKNKRE